MYAEYIRSLGWTVETLGDYSVFIRPFFRIFGLAKIQRTRTLPDQNSLIKLIRKHHIRTLVIEPDSQVTQQEFSRWCRKLAPYVRINSDPFIPSKTIRVDCTASEDDIFNRFTEAKRRAVRRSKKIGVTVSQTEDIEKLIRIKNASAGFMGFITTVGTDKLWRVLSPTQKAILLASDAHGNTIGGLFLIFWDDIAYYWIAGAIPEGKKQFAPTLLVWEALKLAKKNNMKTFDFVGAWDERIPNKNHEWHGFTKFKEGFGGTPLYYPIVLM